jgi:hypothetical protein
VKAEKITQKDNVMSDDGILTKRDWWKPIFLATCCLLIAVCPARAETKLDFWHSYVHQPSGVVHYSFHIANYKRGIFFGSCGPSTRALQWAFEIDLSGNGPVYNKNQINVTSDGQKVEVGSGTIAVDTAQRETMINLRVKASGTEVEFSGNGKHRIVKIK